MRRTRGLHPIRERSLKSRWGLAQLHDGGGVSGKINSIVKFADSLWFGTDAGVLYRLKDGVVTSVVEGFDGTPLRFVITSPSGGLPDQLFVSGGGQAVGLIKVSKDMEVKPWGIRAPKDGFQVQVLPPRRRQVTSTIFNEFGGHPQHDWHVVPIPGGGSPVIANSDLAPGAAIRMLMRPSRLSHVRRILPTPVDLTQLDPSSYDKFPGSSDLDYIAVRVWVDNPNLIDFIQIGLDLTGGGDEGEYLTDYYTALVTVEPRDVLDPTGKDVRPLSELLGARTRPLYRLPDGTLTPVQFAVLAGFIDTLPVAAHVRRVVVRRTKGEAEILPFFAPQQIKLMAQTWSDIKIAKAGFHRSGVDENLTMAAVTAVSLFVHTREVDPQTGQKLSSSDTIIAHFQDFRLEGGYGTKGPTYFHQITYRDSTTGNRSNPNPTPVATPEATTGIPRHSVDRSPFLLTGLPIEDVPPGVDEIEIWRSLGDGSDLFLSKREKIADLQQARPELGLGVAESFDGTADVYDFNRRVPVVAPGTLAVHSGTPDIVTFSDAMVAAFVVVGDHIIIEDRLYEVIDRPGPTEAKLDKAVVGVVGDPTALPFRWNSGLSDLGTLDGTPLPLDNVPPMPFFEDVVLHAGRMWWLSSQSHLRGRLFFSPLGRPESMEDFREVASDEEQLVRLVAWNGSLWVFSRSHIYQVDSGDDPILLREVAGSPGTNAPYTVVPTPLGVFYQAKDGVRLFDGVGAPLIDEALAPLFAGESVEGIPAFEGVFATHSENEYFISDGHTTLAYDFSTRRWREVGRPLAALHYVEEEQRVVAGLGNQLVEVEMENVTDDGGSPISIEWESPSFLVANGERVLVRRVLIDWVANGQYVRPTVVLDGSREVSLPPITGPDARTVTELPLSEEARLVGVRLTGEVLRTVEVIAMEVDYRPLGGVG